MSSSPPRISSGFASPEDRPRLSSYDLQHLRIWHEAANIQEAAAKATIAVRTMQNKLLEIRRQLKVSDDADLREYIDRNGWPEPFPDPPPPPPEPPPSREFTEQIDRRKLAWDKLWRLTRSTFSDYERPGLDLDLPGASQAAYMHEWFKWYDVWPGGEFRPQSPDEALLALLLRRDFIEIERYRDRGNLLITLDSQDPRVDAEARGRIFWALELEPKFAYWLKHDAPIPRRPTHIDPRFLPGGSEFPRTRLGSPNRNLYTNLPYIFPNGESCPSAMQLAFGKLNGQKHPSPNHSRFSFSVEDWNGPDEATVSVDRSYGPLCGNGGRERLHRNGASWRSVVIGRWVS